MPLTNVFSAVHAHPLPSLLLLPPLISTARVGATGCSVFVLTVGQGTQVAQAAVVQWSIQLLLPPLARYLKVALASRCKC